MLGQVQSSSTSGATGGGNGRSGVENVKERAYIEKIKVLKGENKKLINLLRDSEKLFY